MDTAFIYIVGGQSLQNDFMEYFLKKEIAVPCIKVKSPGAVFDSVDDEIQKEAEKVLVLIDNADNFFEQVIIDIEQRRSGTSEKIIIALYNLDHEIGIEHDALRRGVQGFFYKQDNLDLFLKGIKTLFNGEIWLSRDILVNMVLNSNIINISPAQEKAGLTKRELEILALVSMGSKNDEIADKLFISSHTVKTHLYNLFKKIKVDNRFQAALWAAQNL